jgi:hypothetical protein
MTDVEVGQKIECRKCHHTWHTRIPRKPVQCPRCKSTTWDKEMVKTLNGWIELGAKIPGFGSWADMEESDEELLKRLGGGFGPAEPNGE